MKKGKLFESTRARKEAQAAYLFVAPTIIGLLILNFYPIISTFYLSLNQITLAREAFLVSSFRRCIGGCFHLR